MSTSSSEQALQRGKTLSAKRLLLPMELHLSDTWERVLNPTGPPRDAPAVGLLAVALLPASLSAQRAQEIGVKAVWSRGEARLIERLLGTSSS